MYNVISASSDGEMITDQYLKHRVDGLLDDVTSVIQDEEVLSIHELNLLKSMSSTMVIRNSLSDIWNNASKHIT